MTAPSHTDTAGFGSAGGLAAGAGVSSSLPLSSLPLSSLPLSSLPLRGALAHEGAPDLFEGQLASWRDLSERYAQGPGALLMSCDLDQVVRFAGAGLAYLATPFTKEVQRGGRYAPDLGELAVFEASRWAAHLAASGITAISPAVQAVAMVEAGSRLDPLDQDFWQAWCNRLLRRCSSVIIPPLPGRYGSAGVLFEAQAMLARNCRVFVVNGEG